MSQRITGETFFFKAGIDITILFFKVFFFLMWAILKVFTEFVTIFLLFYVLGFGP